jgi:hypothetical protein
MCKYKIRRRRVSAAKSLERLKVKNEQNYSSPHYEIILSPHDEIILSPGCRNYSKCLEKI